MAAINLIIDFEGEDPKPAIEVTTDFSVKQSGCGPASRCEPCGELIAQELVRGHNAMGIWQDLIHSRGFAGGYQSVLRYVPKLRAAAAPEARAIIEMPAGEECQVDYGTGPMERMLDRLLHHGHVFQCGPRNWRTKTSSRGEGQ